MRVKDLREHVFEIFLSSTLLYVSGLCACVYHKQVQYMYMSITSLPYGRSTSLCLSMLFLDPLPS